MSASDRHRLITNAWLRQTINVSSHTLLDPLVAECSSACQARGLATLSTHASWGANYPGYPHVFRLASLDERCLL